MTTWICPKCSNVVTTVPMVKEVAHRCPSNNNNVTGYEEQSK